TSGSDLPDVDRRFGKTGSWIDRRVCNQILCVFFIKRDIKSQLVVEHHTFNPKLQLPVKLWLQIRVTQGVRYRVRCCHCSVHIKGSCRLTQDVSRAVWRWVTCGSTVTQSQLQVIQHH